MPHQFALQERKTALARVLHDIHQAVELLQDAHYINHTHALGLDLPSAKPLTETITAVVQTYQQPQGVVSER